MHLKSFEISILIGVIGRMIGNMDKDPLSGMMMLYLKVNGKKGRSKKA